MAHLQQRGVLVEPTLMVSPWFEARRSDYYDRLLMVSTQGAWDAYVRFFAAGLEASARITHERMIALVGVQASLKERIRGSGLRADKAHTLVDYAIVQTAFTVRAVEANVGISYGRARGLVLQLVELGILAPIEPLGRGGNRLYYAPDALAVLVGE